MFSNHTICVGPYIGDFRSEFLYFLPFVNFIKDNLSYKNFYINSHFNRSFLYEDNFIPILEFLSRDETQQKDVINKYITSKDYQIIKKDLRKNIMKISSCNKNEIFIFSLPYNNEKISLFQRKFKKIIFDPLKIEEDEYILFIPDNIDNIKRCEKIYEYLLKKYKNVIIVGDFKTHLINENLVLKRSDYFTNGFKLIFSYIEKAKTIICPGGIWTAICNLQNKPVISYTSTPGLYKENGEFNFDNNLSKILYYNKEIDINKLYDMISHNIEYFEKNIK